MEFNYIDNKFTYSGSIFDVVKAKWIFTRPKKIRYLFMIAKVNNIQNTFLKKKIVSFLDVRYESFNIYVLFLALKSFKFNKLIENYKKNLH